MSKKKLTERKVQNIKKLLSADELTQAEIALRYRISRSLVSDIATGRVHASVEGPHVPIKLPRGQSKKLPEHDPTDTRILALEAENIHLRDERRIIQRQLTATSKSTGLLNALAKDLPDLVRPLKPLPTARPAYSHKGKGRVLEHLVMHLSDGHHDTIVLPEECGGLETHDFNVSLCRAETYVDTALKWTQETLSPQFDFQDLTILAYGDHTSGEIHNSVQHTHYRNAIKNCLGIGQLHALMYRDLAPYFRSVNIVYVPGNHGRRSIKKDYHGAHDNWDYLIAKHAETQCRDIENVSFTIPNSFSANLNINGIGFCIFHGDDIKSNLGIPWYGLERRTRRTMALSQLQTGPPIQYYCCGHFHRPGTTAELNGELLINGTWVATDAYSYNAFSGFVEPTQIMHGVHHKRGITWRLPIKVRSSYEKKGPKRYKVIV